MSALLKYPQNRGIGKAIAQNLASSFPKPLIIYAASRKGHDLNLQVSTGVQVKYPELDIANSASVEKLAKTIQKDHGAVNVLINNAAAHDLGNYKPESVKTVLDTNVRGTLRVSLCHWL